MPLAWLQRSAVSTGVNEQEPQTALKPAERAQSGLTWLAAATLRDDGPPSDLGHLASGALDGSWR
eukprot:3335590-Pyramimonas_sp.AAC.1